MSERDFFGDLREEEEKTEDTFEEDLHKEPQEKSFPVLGVGVVLIVGIAAAFFIGLFYN